MAAMSCGYSDPQFLNLLIITVSLCNRMAGRNQDSKTLLCDKPDRAITCVFCPDLHLTPMFTGRLQNNLFNGKWSLAKSCFKQNYCHACHARFALFFPLLSCCVSSLIFVQKLTSLRSNAVILPWIFFNPEIYFNLRQFCLNIFSNIKEMPGYFVRTGNYQRLNISIKLIEALQIDNFDTR